MQQEWDADPRGAWQNLLVAQVTDLPAPELLQTRLDEANRELGSPRMRILHHRRLDSMRRELTSARSASAVSAGLTHHRLVLAAHHRYVDGLGMLALLSHLSGHPVTTAVEPLAPVESAEPSSSRASTSRKKAPARVALAHYRNDLLSDVFASIDVPRPVRLTHLLFAATRAARRYNNRRETSSRRMQITLNGFTTDGADPQLGVCSRLVHLPDVETASTGSFARMMRDHPQHSLNDIATQRRHSATLFVAGLGTIEAPQQVRDIAFYPTAGAGLGVSLGATTTSGRTTITARALASRYTEAGLREFLELLRNRLD